MDIYLWRASFIDLDKMPLHQKLPIINTQINKHELLLK